MSPYKINGPALISFSGGRTSAFMLHQIVQAHGGTLPDDVRAVFANTGKEREETLRFIHECSCRWGVQAHWVEWRDGKPGFEAVGLNSASRAGEPFAALIAKKKMPPNWQARFCTEFLKVRAMTALAWSWGWAAYTEVIGLRHDEGMRVLKMLERNDLDKRCCIAPLATSKVTKRDVDEFWSTQPFGLELPPGGGNCDLCFMKSRGLRKELMRLWPSSAAWWAAQEQATGGFFDRRDYYGDLEAETLQQFDMFDAHDADCGLHCAS